MEAAASNPKVASAVASATTMLGAGSIVDIINGWLGLISMIVGALVGCFVIRVNHVKYKILKRAYDNGETPENLDD